MPEFRILAGTTEFLFSKILQTGFGPNQPPIQQLPGVLTPRVKQRKREINLFSPPSSEVKKEWSYTSTTPIFLQVMYMEIFTCGTPTNLKVLF